MHLELTPFDTESHHWNSIHDHKNDAMPHYSSVHKKLFLLPVTINTTALRNKKPLSFPTRKNTQEALQ
jgi:hypothetical protein